MSQDPSPSPPGAAIPGGAHEAGSTGGPGSEPAADRMPRWVKVTLLVVAGVLLVAVAAMLLAPGQHGPGRHASHPKAPVPAVALVAGHA